MLNMNEVRTEQAIAQERYQLIIRVHEAQRARGETDNARPAFHRRVLDWWTERVPQHAAQYSSTRERTV